MSTYIFNCLIQEDEILVENWKEKNKWSAEQEKIQKRMKAVSQKIEINDV